MLEILMPGFWSRTRITLEMIKWEHSIFALPFALTAAILAAHGLKAGAAQILDAANDVSVTPWRRGA